MPLNLGALDFFRHYWANDIYGGSGVLAIGLSAYIIGQNRKSLLNIFYSLIAGLYGLGVLSAYLYSSIPKEQVAQHPLAYYLLFRIARACFSLRQSFLYPFTITTLGIALDAKRPWVAANLAVGCFLALLFAILPRPYIVLKGGSAWLSGNLNDAYLFYSLAVMLYVLAVYFTAVQSAETEPAKNKFRLLSIATFIYSLVLPFTYIPLVRQGLGVYLVTTIG